MRLKQEVNNLQTCLVSSSKFKGFLKMQLYDQRHKKPYIFVCPIDSELPQPELKLNQRKMDTIKNLVLNRSLVG